MQGLGVVGTGVVGTEVVGTEVVGTEVVGIEVVGTTTPVQKVPLRAKSVGVGLEPFHAPLNPNPVLPPVGMVPL